jgi:ethanolamine ammonia-lyase large subunit
VEDEGEVRKGRISRKMGGPRGDNFSLDYQNMNQEFHPSTAIRSIIHTQKLAEVEKLLQTYRNRGICGSEEDQSVESSYVHLQ